MSRQNIEDSIASLLYATGTVKDSDEILHIIFDTDSIDDSLQIPLTILLNPKKKIKEVKT